MKQKKNNITTGGYFLNRLRDSGFVAIRLFKDYPISDPRKWTIMVDPSLIVRSIQKRRARVANVNGQSAAAVAQFPQCFQAGGNDGSNVLV